MAKCEKCGVYPAVITNDQNLDVCSRCDGTVAETFVHQESRVNRNDPCHCGSGKKYKKCCRQDSK